MIEGLKDKVVYRHRRRARHRQSLLRSALRKAGAHVVIADIDKPAAEARRRRDREDFAAPSLALHTDVSDEASTKEMAARVARAFRPDRRAGQQRRGFLRRADEPRHGSKPSIPKNGTG